MRVKYCLPIIKKAKKEVVESLKTSGYDFYEVWVDYIYDINDKFIKDLINQLGERLIVVFRKQNLKETKLSLENKLKIISLFGKSKSILDLDIYDQKEELNYIKTNGLKINTIVSYHNYQETPDDGKIREIIDTMKEYNPAIFKVATRCNNPKDALRLLGLLLSVKEKGVKCIVLGMGEFGIITRIFGTLWGNEMIFAPKNINESSAPGQLSKEKLEKIFDILK